MHYLAYVDILVFKQHTMVLILTTDLKAWGLEEAEELLSLISKCIQQDAEKSKPIIYSIGNGRGESITFLSYDVYISVQMDVASVSACRHIMTAPWLHKVTFIMACM